MCSLNEGMGRAFVEAQAAGLPVIGSRVGGIPEVVYEGRTGFLVDPHDPQDLADRIEELYTMKDRSNVYSGRCRQWVNPRFSSDYMVERIHRLYQELLSERPS
jgi:glycosyltransferase involved in cell wall biosynthesis